ncbi:MAG: YHS domain-containing protein [Acidimicrobiales bacterium]|nr:YHS domain-containing protein [Acidimicrobiales bacterium]
MAGPHRRQRGRTDPVCGMQLCDNEIAARMTIGGGGNDYVFCSTRCLHIFATRTSQPT